MRANKKSIASPQAQPKPPWSILRDQGSPCRSLLEGFAGIWSSPTITPNSETRRPGGGLRTPVIGRSLSPGHFPARPPPWAPQPPEGPGPPGPPRGAQARVRPWNAGAETAPLRENGPLATFPAVPPKAISLWLSSLAERRAPHARNGMPGFYQYVIAITPRAIRLRTRLE